RGLPDGLAAGDGREDVPFPLGEIVVHLAVAAVPVRGRLTGQPHAQPAHLGGGLGPALHVQLGEDPTFVVGHGVRADAQFAGDLRGRAAGADQGEDLHLAGTEPVAADGLPPGVLAFLEGVPQARDAVARADQPVYAGPV